MENNDIADRVRNLEPGKGVAVHLALVTDEDVMRAIGAFNGRGTAFMTLDRADMRAMRAALESFAQGRNG